MFILHKLGVLNIIVYANLVYGNPRLREVDIRKMIFDPSKFARITVPREDMILQEDGYNCGFWVWLCLLEFSLLHSSRYQNIDDFVPSQEDSTGGDRTYGLHKGDWFKLYRNAKAPEAGLLRQPNLDFPLFGKMFFETIRQQATCLFNRIMSLKTGKHFSPRTPLESHVVPNYIRQNFRRLIWDIADDDRKRIDHYHSSFKDRQGELARLLSIENEIIMSADSIYAGTPVEPGGKNEPISGFTVDQLDAAGMHVYEIVDDSNDGDEVQLVTEQDAPTKTTAKPIPAIDAED
jgi:hypothetical protein